MLAIFLTFGNLISGFISLVSNSLISLSYQQRRGLRRAKIGEGQRRLLCLHLSTRARQRLRGVGGNYLARGLVAILGRW